MSSELSSGAVAGRRRRGWKVTSGVEALAGIAVLVMPFVVQDGYALFVLTTIALYLLVAIGLGLLLGFGGQPSIAQGALVAVGAYATAILTVNHGWGFWTATGLGVVAAVAVSMVVALPSFRLSHWHFALVSLAFAVALQSAVTQFRDLTNGFAGIVGIPYATLGGTELDGRNLLFVVLVLDVLAFLLVRSVVRSRLGRGLVAIRDAELVARASGLNVVGLKLFAFGASAVFAGLAGSLYAAHLGVIDPSQFDTDLSVLFLVIVLVGGAGHEWGPAVGAVVFVGAPELLSFLEEWSSLVYGIVLIFVMIFAPRGLAGLAQAWFTRAAAGQRRSRATVLAADARHGEVGAADVGPPPGYPTDDAAGPRGDLVVDDVVRHFGGVPALDGVTVRVTAGSVHAVVGPNGSGKTTLLNLVSGYYRLDSGGIALDGRDISRSAASARARAGIGRTFQTPKVVKTLSARENVMIGQYTQHGCTAVEMVLRLPRAWYEERRQRARADELLSFVGLDGLGDESAGDLPHGQQRLLEIARAVAMSPHILLLDEPAAGLSLGELERLGALIGALRTAGLTVVLVEHHIDLVRDVADTVTVLDQGRVIASGEPDDVFGLESVRASYLGVTA